MNKAHQCSADDLVAVVRSVAKAARERVRRNCRSIE